MKKILASLIVASIVLTSCTSSTDEDTNIDSDIQTEGEENAENAGDNEEPAPGKTVDLDAFIKDAKEMSEFGEEMMAVDKDLLETLYFIDTTNIKDFRFFIAPINVEAEIIAIFQLTDESHVEDFTANINTVVEDLKFTYEGYLPKEYKIVEEAIIETFSEYVIFIVSENSENIEQAIEKYITD